MRIIINEPIFKNGILRIDGYPENEPENIFYIEIQGVIESNVKEVLKRHLETLSRRIATYLSENIKR